MPLLPKAVSDTVSHGRHVTHHVTTSMLRQVSYDDDNHAAANSNADAQRGARARAPAVDAALSDRMAPDERSAVELARRFPMKALSSVYQADVHQGSSTMVIIV